MNDEKMVNVLEAAEILGVKVKTIYSWKERRKVPCYKINGALRFKMKELVEFRDQSRILTEKEKERIL